MNDRPVLNFVSVDSYNLIEIFGQHACGHQTRDARADDNGSLSECLCHGTNTVKICLGAFSGRTRSKLQQATRGDP